jgi:hypothetical protein
MNWLEAGMPVIVAALAGGFMGTLVTTIVLLLATRGLPE